MKKSLRIRTHDTANVNDRLHTYKRWFNGMKHFFTVKTLPPRV